MLQYWLIQLVSLLIATIICAFEWCAVTRFGFEYCTVTGFQPVSLGLVLGDLDCARRTDGLADALSNSIADDFLLSSPVILQIWSGTLSLGSVGSESSVRGGLIIHNCFTIVQGRLLKNVVLQDLDIYDSWSSVLDIVDSHRMSQLGVVSMKKVTLVLLCLAKDILWSFRRRVVVSYILAGEFTCVLRCLM